MDKTYERLHLHYCAADAYALAHKCELVSVCLRGSQNYNLADENSDVDSVAFVIPKGEELVFGDKISTEIHIDDEHCVIKDLRYLYFELCKGSPNMIEALMTDYYFDNPKYHYYMNKLRDSRERYARINVDKTIDSLCGMGFSKTGKNYHATKNLEMITRYALGEPFKNILVSKNINNLRLMKKENFRDEIACEELRSILNQTKKYNIDEEAKEELKQKIMSFFKFEVIV